MVLEVVKVIVVGFVVVVDVVVVVVVFARLVGAVGAAVPELAVSETVGALLPVVASAVRGVVAKPVVGVVQTL